MPDDSDSIPDPASIEDLLAELDTARAMQLLGKLNERETQALLHRAQMKTYKQIALDIPPNPRTGEPLSEIYVRKLLESARKKFGVSKNHDAVIAFMVARIRSNLPLYPNSHLSDAEDTIASAVSDLPIEEVIQLLSSSELRRMVHDAQSGDPKARRRAKYGRAAIAFEIAHWVGWSFLVLMAIVIFAAALNLYNSS